jgi:hypothetical protein
VGSQDHRDHKAVRDPWVKQALQVREETWDHKDLRVHLDSQALMVSRGKLESRDNKVIQEPLVDKVHRVILVNWDRLAQPANQGALASLAQGERLDCQEALDNQDLMDR